MSISAVVLDFTESHQAEEALRRKAGLTQLMEAMARAVNEATTAETALRACH